MQEVYQAMLFAMEKHQGQVRKYTNESYWGHLAEVAGIVSAVDNSTKTLQVAWLHDTIEDTTATSLEIASTFGLDVVKGVTWLTDDEEGNRATRKELARKRLSSAPAWVQSIKYADCLSNLRSITLHDPKFAKVYLKEIQDLLEVMNKGNAYLYAMLLREVRLAVAIQEFKELNFE